MTWLRDWTRGDDPEVRLLCLPPAGGGSQLYRRWPSLLPSSIGVVAVELPGHGSRLGESAVESIGEIVTPLRRAVLPFLDRPLVVFGHSMGSTVGAQLCRALRAVDPDWRPALFVAAGAEPPEVVGARDFSFRHDEAELLSYERRMGGTPDELFDHVEYLDILLPALRADLAVLESVGTTVTAPGLTPPRLDCPLRVYVGDADDSVRSDRLATWSQQSSDVAHRQFTGGHFFVNEVVDDVLQTLRRDIAAATRQPLTVPRGAA